MTGVTIHIDQLDAIKGFSWLSSFSIIADKVENGIPEFQLALFKDGRFPNTERLIFDDVVYHQLTPVWNLRNLQYLEIGKSWGGTGYDMTEEDLTALRRMTELRRLVIHGNFDSVERREQINAALPRCHVEFPD